VGWALHSKFLGTWGASLQRAGGWVLGSHNKTRSHAVLERSLHRKAKEASTRVGFKTYAPDNLTVGGTRLVFQEN
jgi:hypothetical protein